MQETMMQYFEWYLEPDGSLWKSLSSNAAELARVGFTSCWLPPAYKGSAGRNDVGYGVYDMYDLGEFRQKGTIGTKYGTKTQYLKAIKDLQKRGIRAYADIVFNHRMGADASETINARKVDFYNREKSEEELQKVKVWTKYDFPGRKDKYSSFKWNWKHFTGTDFDQKTGDRSILLFEGKHWNSNVSKENGNFDYVMGDDLDFTSPEVISELYEWGKWYTKLTGVSGFRLDAIKSIDSHFFAQWLKEMHRVGNHPDFAVGEFWSGNLWDLKNYLNECGHCMSLLDVPLHYHLQQASQSNGSYDVRNLFAYTLTETDPYYACAFVDNHDTQPSQALESWVLDWFKPQAYATILLNRCKNPVVFYGDYYGIPYSDKKPVPFLKEMVWVRKNLLSDNILDYYDEDPQKACWMAYGQHPVVVIYTIGDWKEKYIQEENYAGLEMVDLTNENNIVHFDENGNARFTCPPGSLGIYIQRKDYDAMKKALKPKTSVKSRLMKHLPGKAK